MLIANQNHNVAYILKIRIPLQLEQDHGAVMEALAVEYT